MSYYSEAREYHDIGKYEEAYKLYVQGANAGDEKCYYGIALFLNEGYYVEKNIEKANEIFDEHFEAVLSLAKSGDAEAMFIVACYYYICLGKSIFRSLYIDRLAFLICRGGWQQAVDMRDEIALDQAIDYYDAAEPTAFTLCRLAA